MGRLLYETYFHILENNLIGDCPVTTTDAKRALTIYRKDAATIKGTTKYKNPEHVENPSLTPFPQCIAQWHLDVTFFIDIFYVNEIPNSFLSHYI